MTHQEIVDRMRALSGERSHAYKIESARIAAEENSLRELCGGLWHVFSHDTRFVVFSGDIRHCVFCNAAEPAKA